MTAVNQNMQALGQALKLEQDGYAFYTKAAERVHDALCKETLGSLAEDEKLHEAMIARQVQALTEENEFVSLPNVGDVELDLSARLFPPDRARFEAKVGDLTTELEVVQMALEIEVESYNHYLHACQSTGTGFGCQMFRWLAGAELTHFNLLMANYEALERRMGWN